MSGAEEALMGVDLAGSRVVGEWHASGPMFICPGGMVDPEECDCGYKGEWDFRSVLTWCVDPGFHRPTWLDHKDTARGWPIISPDGWWVISGWDEKCPVCGDIERFDGEGNEVRRFKTLGVVVSDPDVVLSSSDLRAILAMTDLLVDLTPVESIAVQRARAALLDSKESADA